MKTKLAILAFTLLITFAVGLTSVGVAGTPITVAPSITNQSFSVPFGPSANFRLVNLNEEVGINGRVMHMRDLVALVMPSIIHAKDGCDPSVPPVKPCGCSSDPLCGPGQ